MARKRNNLATLNNLCFEMIERIMDPELTDEERTKEIQTATAVGQMSKTILDNARLELDVMRLQASERTYVAKEDMPDLLALEDK